MEISQKTIDEVRYHRELNEQLEAKGSGMEELGILLKATDGIATVNVNRFRSGRVCIEVVASGDESRDEFSFSGSSLSEVAKSAYAKALALGLTNDV